MLRIRNVSSKTPALDIWFTAGKAVSGRWEKLEEVRPGWQRWVTKGWSFDSYRLALLPSSPRSVSRSTKMEEDILDTWSHYNRF